MPGDTATGGEKTPKANQKSRDTQQDTPPTQTPGSSFSTPGLDDIESETEGNPTNTHSSTAPPAHVVVRAEQEMIPAAQAHLTLQTTVDSISLTPCSGERENKQEGALNSKISSTQSLQGSLDNDVVTKSNLETEQGTEYLYAKIKAMYTLANSIYDEDDGPKEDEIIDLFDEVKMITFKKHFIPSDINDMEEKSEKFIYAVNNSKIFKRSQNSNSLIINK